MEPSYGQFRKNGKYFINLCKPWNANVHCGFRDGPSSFGRLPWHVLLYCEEKSVRLYERNNAVTRHSFWDEFKVLAAFYECLLMQRICVKIQVFITGIVVMSSGGSSFPNMLLKSTNTRGI